MTEKEPSYPALLIFDVDGTLTHSAGLTRVAFETVFQEIYGVAQATAGVNPHGRTDPMIFRDVLTRNSIEIQDFDRQFDEFSDQYVVLLERLLGGSKQVHLHKGVKALLEKLKPLPNIYLALGTGNVERAAFHKLNRHGIAHFFPAGGFGSDDEDRSRLLLTAHERAQNYYRKPFPIRDTWIIGDTPNDVLSGQRIGASTIAVATGDYDLQILARSRPDGLLPDFDDQERFLSIIRRKIKLTREFLVKDSFRSQE